MNPRKDDYSILCIRLLLVLLFLFGGSNGSGSTSVVYAEEAFQITIVKYKLSEQDLDNHLLPSEPTGSLETGLTNEQGKALTPFPGIRYQIKKVTPSNDASDPFTEIPSFEPIEIVTGSNGQATIPLTEGLYEVTELANDALSSPAEPVVVQLPAITADGTRLDQLFIYPKSSVVVSPTEGATPRSTTPKQGKATAKRIPQTSGNLGSLFPVYFTLALIILLGIVTIVNFKPKGKKKP